MQGNVSVKPSLEMSPAQPRRFQVTQITLASELMTRYTGIVASDVQILRLYKIVFPFHFPFLLHTMLYYGGKSNKGLHVDARQLCEHTAGRNLYESEKLWL